MPQKTFSNSAEVWIEIFIIWTFSISSDTLAAFNINTYSSVRNFRGSNCKIWGKIPQVHLIIIRE